MASIMKAKILSTKLFSDQIALFYLGQLGFLIKYREKYILIDGYLTDSVDRHSAGGPVAWVRNYPSPIAPEELDFVDYIFCTHDHGDHADAETLCGILQVNDKAKYIVSSAFTGSLVKMGIPEERIQGVCADQKICLEGKISVTPIPAAHEELRLNEKGEYFDLGFVFEFASASDTESVTLYHSGDCCPYKGLDERIAGVDVMIVPVNGRDYYRTQVQNIIGCFDSREAAVLAKNAGAKLLIPAHFDLYNVNCINPAHFVDELKTVNPKQAFHMFVPGERYIYDK